MKLKTNEHKKQLRTLEQLEEAISNELTLLIVNEVVTVDLNNLSIYNSENSKIGYIVKRPFRQKEYRGEPVFDKKGNPVGVFPIEIVLNPLPKLLENEVPFLVLRQTSIGIQAKTWSICTLLEDAKEHSLDFTKSPNNEFLAYTEIDYKFIQENYNEYKQVLTLTEGTVFEYKNFKEYSQNKAKEYLEFIEDCSKEDYNKRKDYKVLFTFRGKKYRVIIPKEEYLKENSLAENVTFYMTGRFG